VIRKDWILQPSEVVTPGAAAIIAARSVLPGTDPQKNSRFLRSFLSGGEEDRTPDLLNAIQALYQLSYTPSNW
jgi:hypothetical protein